MEQLRSEKAQDQDFTLTISVKQQSILREQEAAAAATDTDYHCLQYS